MEKSNIEIFEHASIPRAVFKNAIPSIVSMLMVLIYNLADTFFIGQTHNPFMVAAVSLATPVFLLFMAIGTLFGIGGTSMISRAFGRREPEYAKKISSFCFWTGVGVGVVCMAALLIFVEDVCTLIGTSADTREFTKSYLTIVGSSAVFTIVSTSFSNILRAEGRSTQAMIGVLVGNVVNVILDPIMILVFKWGVAGAALATVIGNVVGAMYYVIYFLRGKSSLSIKPRDFSVRNRICTGVLAIGVPAALQNMLMSVSHIITNAVVAGYDDMAVAGMGVASKVMMIVVILISGFAMGVQPLLGYCCGARNWDRFRKILRFSLITSTIFAVVMSVACYAGAGFIVNSFIDAPAAFGFGVKFARILLIAGPVLGLLFLFINSIQAVGAAIPSLILSVCRQGIIYIPLMFVFDKFWQLDGVTYAQPVTDILATVLSAVLYVVVIRKRMKEMRESAERLAKE